MKETLIVVGATPHFEYFCWHCGQLRLAFKELWACGNCGSIDILKGVPGTLDKAKLSSQRLCKPRYVHRHNPKP
jgi:DNA-directed RNA polymerase subunit RPC12/RpoP